MYTFVIKNKRPTWGPSRSQRPRQFLETEQRCYPPEPIITIGMVGVVEPCSGSMVMAKALASTPAGSGGLTTTALPRVSGLKTPAGIGAPCLGMSQSSYAFWAGRGLRLLAIKIS